MVLCVIYFITYITITYTAITNTNIHITDIIFVIIHIFSCYIVIELYSKWWQIILKCHNTCTVVGCITIVLHHILLLMYETVLTHIISIHRCIQHILIVQLTAIHVTVYYTCYFNRHTDSIGQLHGMIADD